MTGEKEFKLNFTPFPMIPTKCLILKNNKTRQNNFCIFVLKTFVKVLSELMDSETPTSRF